MHGISMRKLLYGEITAYLSFQSRYGAYIATCKVMHITEEKGDEAHLVIQTVGLLISGFCSFESF